MSIYTDSDIKLLYAHQDKIKNELEKFKMESSEPTQEEHAKAHDIIKKFCKENKRKLYGGYALHLLLQKKDPNAGIYKTNRIPDIDIYSPYPLNDMYTLCNLLFRSGLKCIMGQEALHRETYTIKFYNETICDITYVPRNVYNKMPFLTIEDMICISPNFMTIDYLRILSNPLDSYWRIFDCSEDFKALHRYNQLQKFYPLPYCGQNLWKYNPKPQTSKLIEAVFLFLVGRTSTVVIGFYAYNYFATILGYETINIPYFEFISTDYRKDALELKELLLKIDSSITLDEFCPFFQYTDYSVEIYVGEFMFCRIYGNNKRCVPYQDVTPYGMQTQDKIRLGSFTIVILHMLVNAQISRVKNEKVYPERFYYDMLSHCIQFRDEYFKKFRKNFLDNNPFKDFVTQCVGTEITASKEMRMRIEKRKLQKKPLVHRYVPADELKEEVPKYVFCNASGNKIINPKYLRLGEEIKEDFEDVDDAEDAESSPSST